MGWQSESEMMNDSEWKNKSWQFVVLSVRKTHQPVVTEVKCYGKRIAALLFIIIIQYDEECWQN